MNANKGQTTETRRKLQQGSAGGADRGCSWRPGTRLEPTPCCAKDAAVKPTRRQRVWMLSTATRRRAEGWLLRGQSAR